MDARFPGLQLPERLVAFAVAPPDGPQGSNELESAVERVVQALPTSESTTTPLLGEVDVDAVIVAALRECRALASGSFETVHQHADRVRYGLVPALEQLGMWELKRRLEDTALQAETPDRYDAIVRQFDAFRGKHERFVAWTRDELAEALATAGIDAEVTPVFCGVDGVSRRLKALVLGESLTQAGVTEFYDLLVIVPSESECYRALAAVHHAGTPVPRTLEDYVCAPRRNGFSGILTHVSMMPQWDTGAALVAQVIIQTPLMNEVSRFGIAEPGCYARAKSGGSNDDAPAFIRALLATVSGRRRDGVPSAPSKICVLAEGGRERLANPREMPDGATVLDLAYLIHRQLGNEAASAKVNGKRVGVGQVLKHNDRVEIVRGESGRRTEEDVRNVTTKRARRYLREHLNRDNLTRGRYLIRLYLEQNRGILLEDRAELDQAASEVAKQYRAKLDEVSAEALYRKVGDGSDRSVTEAAVGADVTAVIAAQRATATLPPNTPVAEWTPTFAPGVSVEAKRLKICGRCSPGPTHEIVGAVLSRHVTVHRPTCINIRTRPRIALEWKRIGRTVRSVITLFCEDRPLLVHSICQRISRRGSGLEEIHASADEFARARVTVHVYSNSAIALGDLLDDLRWIRSVRAVDLVSTSLPQEEKEHVLGGDWRRLRQDLERRTGTQGPALVEPPRGADRRRGDIVLPYNEQKPAYWTDWFFGRSAEIGELIARTTGDSPAYVLVTGPRRIGKTSLALRFTESLPAVKRPHVARVDLRMDRRAPSDAVLWRIAGALRPLGGSSARQHNDPKEAVEAAVACSEKPVLLILDEFAAVLESFERGSLGHELFAWIRTTMEGDSETSRRLRLVMVAPPEGVELLHSPAVQPYLDRLVPLRISTLDRDAAREMIMRPFSEKGVNFNRQAAEKLITLTGGHPYYLILFLREITALLNARPTKWEVTPKDVTRLTNRVLQHPYCFHGAVNEPGALPAHHACLRAVAQLQEQPSQLVEREEIVRRAKLGGGATDAALDRLTSYGVFERRLAPGFAPRYRFAIPLVQAWVRRHRNADLGARPIVGLRSAG